MELTSIFFSLLFRAPLFILWLVGIVIALIRFKRHPRVSISAILGFLIVGFTTFLSLILPSLTKSVSQQLLR